jgi:hypothetical protein
MDFNHAITNQNMELFHQLLADGVDPSEKDNQAVLTAARYGNVEIVDRLLQDSRVNPAARNNQAIIVAAQYNDGGMIQRLLQDPRVDPADRNNKAIETAAKHGNIDAVEILLQDPRVDPTVNENQPFVNACNNRHFNVVDLLLQDPRIIPDRYILIALIRASRVDMVQRILQDPRTDPNVAVSAVSPINTNPAIIDLLVRHPKLRADEENMYFATMVNNVNVLHRMISEAGEPDSDTMLELVRMAAQMGHLEMVKFLLTFPNTRHSSLDIDRKGIDPEISKAISQARRQTVNNILLNPRSGLHQIPVGVIPSAVGQFLFSAKRKSSRKSPRKSPKRKSPRNSPRKSPRKSPKRKSPRKSPKKTRSPRKKRI